MNPLHDYCYLLLSRRWVTESGSQSDPGSERELDGGQTEEEGSSIKKILDLLKRCESFEISKSDDRGVARITFDV